MRKIGEDILYVLVILILAFIVVPIILLVSLFTSSDPPVFDKKYAEFLRQNDGKNFFCYNNRKNSKEYIEQEIIPQLGDNVEIIYLNGKVTETSNYSTESISNLLHDLKSYSKFPHLMKIRQGELIDKSINNLFFSVRNQNKPEDQLLTEIHDFFEANKKTVETELSNSEG